MNKKIIAAVAACFSATLVSAADTHSDGPSSNRNPSQNGREAVKTNRGRSVFSIPTPKPLLVVDVPGSDHPLIFSVGDTKSTEIPKVANRESVNGGIWTGSRVIDLQSQKLGFATLSFAGATQGLLPLRPVESAPLAMYQSGGTMSVVGGGNSISPLVGRILLPATGSTSGSVNQGFSGAGRSVLDIAGTTLNLGSGTIGSIGGVAYTAGVYGLKPTEFVEDKASNIIRYVGDPTFNNTRMPDASQILASFRGATYSFVHGSGGIGTLAGGLLPIKVLGFDPADSGSGTQSSNGPITGSGITRNFDRTTISALTTGMIFGPNSTGNIDLNTSNQLIEADDELPPVDPSIDVPSINDEPGDLDLFAEQNEVTDLGSLEALSALLSPPVLTPEPSAGVLFIGLAGVALRRRRSR